LARTSPSSPSAADEPSGTHQLQVDTQHRLALGQGQLLVESVVAAIVRIGASVSP
jgi:hypothetical protein